LGKGEMGTARRGLANSPFARGGGLRVKKTGIDDVQAAGNVGRIGQPSKIKISARCWWR